MGATFFEGIYCLLLYLFVVIAFRDFNLIKFNRSKYTKYYHIIGKILALLVLIYSVTDYVDLDYFHYYDYIVQLKKFNISDLEKSYDNIAKLVGYNYLFFRIFVWGIATFLLYKIYLISKVNIIHLFYSFFVIYICLFAYGRVSLAMSVFFYGLLIFKIKRKFFIGALIILLSIVFHRSMILLIFLSIIPVFDWNKRHYVKLGAVIIIGIILINYFLREYLLFLSIDDEVVSKKVNFYSNQENTLDKLSLLGAIRYIMGYLIFYLPLLLSIYAIIKSKRLNFQLPNVIKLMFQFSILICSISMIFEFVDLSTNVIAYRIRFMSMIPLSIILVYFVDKNLIKFPYYKLIIILGFIYNTMNTISVIKQA